MPKQKFGPRELIHRGTLGAAAISIVRELREIEAHMLVGIPTRRVCYFCRAVGNQAHGPNCIHLLAGQLLERVESQRAIENTAIYSTTAPACDLCGVTEWGEGDDRAPTLEKPRVRPAGWRVCTLEGIGLFVCCARCDADVAAVERA